MENAEEILQCLDEFSKLKPKDIPRELEEYLCFVAKTGDPVYQWPLIKCLFREKLISVITEFYEACPSVEIPPCPNVDAFNYDAMKSFILEKLDTFAAAPFTVQRICELLTSPRKEYNRIDKYMRALEKNILVVSTREPGSRKSTENGESIVNGLESEHVSQEIINSDINVEVEMDETAVWPKTDSNVAAQPFAVNDSSMIMDTQPTTQAPTAAGTTDNVQDTFVSESIKTSDSPVVAIPAVITATAAAAATTAAAVVSNVVATCSSSIETVITSRPIGYIGYTPNITDLIIEPSAISSTPEAESTAEPTSAQQSSETTTNTTSSSSISEPAQQTIAVEAPTPQQQQQQPATVVETAAVLSMSTEPIVPVDTSTPTTKNEEPVPFVATAEQSETVFVKADCSDSVYVSVDQPEPEPSVVQVDQPPEKVAETVSDESMVREPEQSDAVVAARPSETVSSEPQVQPHAKPAESVQVEVVVSSAEIEPQPSSAARVEPEPSGSFAATTTTTTSTTSTEVEQSDCITSEEQSNETTISSTNEQDHPAGSSDVQSSAEAVASDSADTAAEPSCTTSDNQVSESNISSEYHVSQTDTKLVDSPTEAPSDIGPEATSSEMTAMAQTTAESTVVESMEVDEAPVQSEVPESSSVVTESSTTGVRTEPSGADN